MQCKCRQEMMKEGKECCCKGMMSGMKKHKRKDGGKMQCPICAKMKEEKMSKPSPDEHEQHH